MFGTFLRRVRESRGLSQETLAAVSGIAQPNISAYENDRRVPSLETFNVLLVSCGYQLAADGGSSLLHAPFPIGAGGVPFDDLPPRLPDDPPDQQPTIARDATVDERRRALVAVLDLARAIDAGRASTRRG